MNAPWASLSTEAAVGIAAAAGAAQRHPPTHPAGWTSSWRAAAPAAGRSTPLQGTSQTGQCRAAGGTHACCRGPAHCRGGGPGGGGSEEGWVRAAAGRTHARPPAATCSRQARGGSRQRRRCVCGAAGCPCSVRAARSAGLLAVVPLAGRRQCHSATPLQRPCLLTGIVRPAGSPSFLGPRRQSRCRRWRRR